MKESSRLHDLLFRLFPAIQVIYKLGFEPKEESFHELTPEEYRHLEKEGRDVSRAWYRLTPTTPGLDGPELLVVDEDQREDLLDAARFLHSFHSRTFGEQGTGDATQSFCDKLKDLARVLPEVFSDESEFEKWQHLRIVN